MKHDLKYLIQTWLDAVSDITVYIVVKHFFDISSIERNDSKFWHSLPWTDSGFKNDKMANLR